MIIIFLVLAIPEFKEIFALRLSKLRPLEKKSEKSNDSRFGIDAILNNPST